MLKLKAAFISAVLFGAAILPIEPAIAMPVSNLVGASKTLTTETQTVIWRCGWYRCWWTPSFAYRAPYYRPRPWAPYWGWRRPYWSYGWRPGW
jgi:hypothetical protein